ncbi:DUF3077 domain-containing protein [Pseudomonas entomophila]|uniref:DUF3077 domain-containing protein n=1 Tax=Pseudomonas entomophila TaxID=312306 RepID=UPI003EBAB1DF
MKCTQPTVTRGITTFGLWKGDKPLFRISPHVPAKLALEQTAVIVECVERLTLQAAQRNDRYLVYAANVLSELAEAIIDDLGTLPCETPPSTAPES